MLTIKIDDRIELRQIQITDASDIFETINFQRAYLGKWLPFVEYTKTIHDSELFINSIYSEPPEKQELVFVIHFEKKFAGIIGFKDTDKTNKKTEIGYWLSESFQKKGIITESLKKLIHHAFEKMDINRIQIKCAAENIRSQKIPKRLNFVFEGIERDGELLSDGEFTDLEVYSIIRRDRNT
ncbi:MAG: GNAT family N-acetyltransferase [Fibrobacter sp.]|nr:GNAT family N-acetyltransferase [Fibrobacter sp.]